MIAAELRARRVALGLSQEALARRLDVSMNTVARWERGALHPAHPRMLQALLDVIEREIEEQRANLARS